jgi:hypothetical protein
MNLAITIESQVNPTEDQVKVERAIRNLFASGEIERVSSGEEVIRLRLHGKDLEFLSKLRSLIKQERIRSAARSIIFGRTSGNRIHFYVNKQAAFSGRVSFCEPVGESPNGPISIEIFSDNPEIVTDYLASRPEASHLRFQDER